MRDENPKEPEQKPKVGLPLESPYYEEQFDPYFTEQIEVSENQQDRQVGDDEEWYSEDYWIEEGMWPWPEPRVKRRQEQKLPEEKEPPRY